jgi:hypothetical protein
MNVHDKLLSIDTGSCVQTLNQLTIIKTYLKDTNK